LAAGVALADKDAASPVVAAQALIYPLTDLTASGASVDARPHEPFLSRDDLHAYLAAYLAGGADPRDPLLSPLWAPDLAGLSPALVLAADHDPLIDDARRYVERLRASDVPVEHVEYADSPHGFLTFPRACAAAGPALEQLVSWLREVLSRPEEAGPPGPDHQQVASHLGCMDLVATTPGRARRRASATKDSASPACGTGSCSCSPAHLVVSDQSGLALLDTDADELTTSSPGPSSTSSR
jgi:hypothetical protein